MKKLFVWIALVGILLAGRGLAETKTGLADMTRTVAAEGIVMLKNERQVLPLTPDRTVSIFGRIQVDYFACGYGSGGDVKTPYTINILDAMRKHPGITVNEAVSEVYEAWCETNPPDDGSWGNWPLNHPEMPLEDDLVAMAAASSDTALVIIGRSAGEDREAKLEPGSYYLTNAEKEMLGRVDKHFEQVVILVNAGNIIDMSWVNEYQHIASVLYIWQGGMQGGKAVADVLSGDVSPSGKLMATIANQYTDYPTSGSSGGEKIFGGIDFSNYVEDIYVGYRYFETFVPDAVKYPFGFGLSYTDFDIKVQGVEVSNGIITADVTVENIGSTYSGKEVVQVYYGAPQGLLGKAVKSLAAYAKTRTLAPGEREEIRLSYRVNDMASYDDSGVTGHKSAYVIEAGEYPVYVGNSVRSASKVGVHTEMQLRVTEQLSEIVAVPEDSRFQRMRAAVDNDGTLVPRFEDVPTRTVPEIIERNRPRQITPIQDRGIKLTDVLNERASMSDFIAQCSVEELEALCRGDYDMNSSLGAAGNAAVFGGVTESLREKGVAPVTAIDGPSGIRLTASASLLPIGTAIACSWNDNLIEEMYRMVGSEMLLNHADVLLAPGMNIQRDPLGGRNFEYFSEDPLLTGQMGASVVRGLQSQGVSATPKHFALNNQETQRTHNDSRCSERAIREIYAKSFEIVVKTARPHNLMASYNRINGVYSHYHYDLMTRMLRGEWGYEGVVMTDWWIKPEQSPDNPQIYDNAYRVQAQVDVLMPGTGPKDDAGDRSLLDSYETGKGITLGEMQRCAVNTLNYVMKSPAFRKANGLDTYAYRAAGDPFIVQQESVEHPRLAALSLNGEPLLPFNPLVRSYDLYMPNTAEMPHVDATSTAGCRVEIMQPSKRVPVATIKVSNAQARSIYRIHFSDEAGLTPSVKDPVYARILDLYVNGAPLPQFYPGIYEYEVPAADLDQVSVTADVPPGITYDVLEDADRDRVIVRAESPHQAMEYTLVLTPGNEVDSRGKTIGISPAGATRMEAEDYVYKTDTIQTQACEDAGGGMNVGYVTTGEYLLYEIDVQKDGMYSVSSRIASDVSEVTQLSYQIEVDGEIVASFMHGGTGGWQNWQSTEEKQIHLTEGTHKLRVSFNTADVNMNYLVFRRSS